MAACVGDPRCKAVRQPETVERGQDQRDQEQRDLQQREVAVGGAEQGGQAADQFQPLDETGAGKDQDTGEADRRKALAHRRRLRRRQSPQAQAERQQRPKPEAGGGEMKEFGKTRPSPMAPSVAPAWPIRPCRPRATAVRTMVR